MQKRYSFQRDTLTTAGQSSRRKDIGSALRMRNSSPTDVIGASIRAVLIADPI
jgi:hypothetical protein